MSSLFVCLFHTRCILHVLDLEDLEMNLQITFSHKGNHKHMQIACINLRNEMVVSTISALMPEKLK